MEMLRLFFVIALAIGIVSSSVVRKESKGNRSITSNFTFHKTNKYFQIKCTIATDSHSKVVFIGSSTSCVAQDYR